MRESFPSARKGVKICDDYRKKLTKLKARELSDFEEYNPCIPTPSVKEFAPDPRSRDDSDPSIAPVNEFLQAVGETPITKRKIRTQKYSKQNMEIITSKLK